MKILLLVMWMVYSMVYALAFPSLRKCDHFIIITGLLVALAIVGSIE